MGMTRGATRAAVAGPTASAIGKWAELWQAVRRERWMYLFILPGFLYFVVFRYLPLLGNIIAFQDYSPFLGFRGSPFNGLDNFRKLFTDPDVGTCVGYQPHPRRNQRDFVGGCSRDGRPTSRSDGARVGAGLNVLV